VTIINKQEIIKSIISKLRLDPGRDKIPIELIDKIMPVMIVNESGDIRFFSDVSVNSSDKTFAVPVGMRWEIQNIFVNLTTTSDVGNRIITIRYIDADGSTVISSVRSDISQPASVTRRSMYSPEIGTIDQTSSSDSFSYIPRHVLGGQSIRVLDSAVIDADGDDMLVFFMIKEFSIEG